MYINTQNPSWLTTSNYQQSERPELHITRSKCRLKLYDRKVYLNKGDNFELEVFNPNSHVIGFRIKLNGQHISQSKIVLQPGQRVYLERFIDTNAKFKFDTYEVETNNKQVDKAIANNGLLEVEYFSIIQPLIGNSTFTYLNGSLTTAGGYYYSSPTTEVPYTFTNTCSTSVGCDSLNSGPELKTLGNIVKSNVKETGRVEAGVKSDQQFTTVNYDFNSLAFATDFIQLLPVIEKPLEVNKLRNYCTGCAYRVRDKKWKFCPKCGTEI